MNSVLAVVAKYSHLTKANQRANEHEHVIYQLRARALGLNEHTLTYHPDVSQNQIAGLSIFYYLSIGKISR